MKSAKRIAAKIKSLPPLPGIVREIMAMNSQEEFDMDNLVALVSFDPALTTTILQKCNSSFFGLRHKVSSIHQAVNLMGLDNIVDIALSSGFQDYYNGEHSGYHLAKGELWKHSMATALVGKRLARLFKYPDIHEAHTAGLLHDMGKLVLSEFLQEEFHNVEALIMEEGWPVVDAEKQILGVNHAELGMVLAHKWKLGHNIEQAVAWHHNPGKSEAPRTLPNLISLANYLSTVCGQSASAPGAPTILPPTVLFDLNLQQKHIEALKADAARLLASAQDILSLAD